MTRKTLKKLRENAAKARAALAAKRAAAKQEQVDCEEEECCGEGLANPGAWMLKGGTSAFYVGQPGDHVEVLSMGTSFSTSTGRSRP